MDNDGDADLLLACLGQDHLLLNDGRGHFTAVSRQAGLVEDYEFGAGATLFDADRDGLLDLFLTRYVSWTPETDRPCLLPSAAGPEETLRAYCTPQLYAGASPRFYRNLGGGTFAERTRRSGLFAPGAKALGATVLDADDDGWLDLAVACDTAPNLLFRNRGGAQFTEIALAAGVAVSETGQAKGGMGIDAADFDGSGRESLLLSYFAHEALGLYRNEGDLFFLDVAGESELGPKSLPTLGWGTFFFDYDLDGDLDIFVANGHLGPEVEATPAPQPHAQPAQLFAQQGDGRFREVTEEMGGDLARPRVARGAAWGDLDGDGDPDLVLSTNGGPARVFENRQPPGAVGNWLQVALVGVESNRQGVGARVRITAGGLLQSRRLRTGGSYLSQSQTEPLFGLGPATRVEEVEVSWPSGRVQTLTGVEANQRLVIREEVPAEEGAEEGQPGGGGGR